MSGGRGKEKKERGRKVGGGLLALPGAPSPDAADALACAICHAHGGRLGNVLTKNLKMKKGRLV